MFSWSSLLEIEKKTVDVAAVCSRNYNAQSKENLGTRKVISHGYQQIMHQLYTNVLQTTGRLIPCNQGHILKLGGR